MKIAEYFKKEIPRGEVTHNLYLQNEHTLLIQFIGHDRIKKLPKYFHALISEISYFMVNIPQRA